MVGGGLEWCRERFDGDSGVIGVYCFFVFPRVIYDIRDMPYTLDMVDVVHS